MCVPPKLFIINSIKIADVTTTQLNYSIINIPKCQTQTAQQLRELHTLSLKIINSKMKMIPITLPPRTHTHTHAQTYLRNNSPQTNRELWKQKQCEKEETHNVTGHLFSLDDENLFTSFRDRQKRQQKQFIIIVIIIIVIHFHYTIKRTNTHTHSRMRIRMECKEKDIHLRPFSFHFPQERVNNKKRRAPDSKTSRLRRCQFTI